MAVHITRGLEPAGYWQQVGELANELLAASPLRSWTVTVRPRESSGAAVSDPPRWTSHIDYGTRTFDVGVPASPDDVDEASPEDAATHVVLDLLSESVSDVEDHVPPRPPAEPSAANPHPLAPPPAMPTGGDGAAWAG